MAPTWTHSPSGHDCEERKRPSGIARVGERLPHGLRNSGLEVADHLDSRRLTLLTFAVGHEEMSAMLDAAHAKGVLIKVVPLCEPHLATLYGFRFLLVRPDRNVCWLSHEMPSSCEQLIDDIRKNTLWRPWN
ncbi:MAG: hypothetical protein EOP36_14365 [Rubrivivax sp.]|nr:MAG: hypothetical protein EOP36_14365 [Rubrivivax sp.]